MRCNTKELQKNRNLNKIIIAGLVIVAIICRILGKVSSIYIYIIAGVLRTLIYIGLYIGWGISINKRVVQKAAKNTLLFISGLMIFWFIVRSIKYFFAMDVNVERYSWYSYYLPMLFIPQAAVQMAVLLGQPEEYTLPKWSKLLYIPTTLCSLLVLTNDFHQLVFSFSAGEVWTDKGYSYAWGYYIVLLWDVICAVSAFVLMVYKCRSSRRKKYLPIIGICISIIYAIIYASGAEWMQVIGGDITAALCLMFMCIFESCLHCGLIQTNTGYEQLFEVCTMGAQITDQDYHVIYTSANAMKLSEMVMREAEKEEDLAESRRLLAKISLIGTYIKRYGNLIFIGEREAVSDIAELGACLEESFSSLRLMGIECALTAPAGERIYVRDAVRIYSFFESILEACVDSIKFMWVKIRPCGEEMVFCMEVESEDDLNSFFDKTDQGENEDGIWKFTFIIKKAGEK